MPENKNESDQGQADAEATKLDAGETVADDISKTGSTIEQPSSREYPRSIAHFRILSVLGEGGMAYVDLNPIRAAIAKTPEQSDYTSIQERIEHPTTSCLMPLAENERDCLPINLKDYLELVDWGGREVKHNKRGYIHAYAPPILARLRMDAAPVLSYLAKDDLPSLGALGPINKLRDFAKSVGQKFFKGHVIGSRLCPQTAR